MHRLLICVGVVGILSWLGNSSAMAQGTNQNQPNRATTTVGGTAGISTNPTTAVPGGTNLNQGTGAQPTLQNFGTGFVGNSQNSGRFVGSQFSGQQQVRAGSTGRNMFSSGGRGRAGGSGRFTMPNQSSRNSRTKRVRPRHRVAFSFSSRSMTTIKTSLDTRFSFLLPRRPEFKGVTIAVGKAGELTLAGEVPSATARRMAVAMVRMEPGVRKVTNELSVAAAEPTDGQ